MIEKLQNISSEMREFWGARRKHRGQKLINVAIACKKNYDSCDYRDGRSGRVMQLLRKINTVSFARSRLIIFMHKLHIISYSDITLNAYQFILFCFFCDNDRGAGQHAVEPNKQFALDSFKSSLWSFRGENTIAWVVLGLLSFPPLGVKLHAGKFSP